MTDGEFYKCLLDLSGKLARAASAEPYDPDANKAIIDELISLCHPPIQRQRRLSLLMIAILIFVCTFLSLIIYDILLYLLFSGPQK
jgi:hypothetical protein